MLFLLLTVFTQIGGVVLLLCIPVFRWHRKKINTKGLAFILQFLSFIIIYLILTFTVVPWTAKPLGRIPLPIYSESNIRPLNLFTCLLNRHYVRPELYKSLKEAAEVLNEKYPGTVIAYLDAGFPFLDGFPLMPHLSHHDGKKLDLAFFYRDATTEEMLNGEAPSYMGYGVFEEPASGEEDMPSVCAGKGAWQYSMLRLFVPQWNKDEMVFDQKRTRDLIRILAKDPVIGKIFIEPHLKERMNLKSDKIRFHGCRAVRHDDHIHVQLH